MSRTTLLMAKVKLVPPYHRLILIFSQGDYHGQDVQQPSDYSNHPDQTVEVTHEEQKKKWWDLDDERKKQLKVRALSEVVVGISHYPRSVAALRQALLSSVRDTTPGTSTRNTKNQTMMWDYYFIFCFTRYLYLSIKKKKEALTWGAQGWAKDSQATTEEFRNHGPRAPATWVLVEGRDNIPSSAFVAGNDKDGNKIYVARAYFEHGLRTFYQPYFFHPLIHCLPCLEIGKASANFKQGSAIGYAGKVVEVTRSHTIPIPVHKLTSK